MQRWIDIVRVRIEELAARIGAPERWLPDFGNATDHAQPFVRERDGWLEWGVAERGNEYEVKRTRDIDELCYWALESIASSLSTQWELHHRVEGQDFRILMFAKRIELLAALDPRWAARSRAENAQLLRDVGLEAG
jgi:immunity protein 63 of polymorphic toxin system